MNYVIDTEQIQAAAFRTIARFIHISYDDKDVSNVTGGEGCLIGIVRATESLVAAVEKESQE